MYLIPVVALNATVIVIIAIWALTPRNLTEAIAFLYSYLTYHRRGYRGGFS